MKRFASSPARRQGVWTRASTSRGMIREVQDGRDDLHLALEQQIHPVMRWHPRLVHVTSSIPTIEHFSIERIGYDD
jgi:hypothetical protein